MPQDSQTTGSLELESQQVLPRLRNALGRLLREVPGVEIRPAVISRSLGLHQTLAWKVAQIVGNPDPFATVQHIPGEGGLEIVLQAASGKGADAATVEAVRAAAAEFRRLIESHAGDRDSLELMLAGLARRPVSPVELSIRKDGFRCASYTWGMQCRARTKTLILREGEVGGKFDIVSVLGYVGLRRMRANTPWPLSRRKYFDEKGQATQSPQRLLDADGVVDGVPLVAAFCSRPLPELQTARLATGELEVRLAPGPVGEQAAINCVFGNTMPSTGFTHAAPDDPYFDNGLHIRTPTEVVIIDTFVHEKLWPEMKPISRVISELGEEPWFSPNKPESELLPFPEQVELLGRGAGAAGCAEYAQYPDLMEHVFGKLGWNGEEFRLYRLRIEYPVLRTAVVMRFDRPNPGVGV